MIAPTIETERLVLRAVTLDRFDQQHAFMSDPRVMTFIGAGKGRTRQESWMKYCQSAGLWSLMGYGYWAFVDKATDRMIGMGGLGSFERGLDQLIGYPEAGWAFSADYWGKGVATEAMQGIFSWADANLEAKEVRCIIAPGNLASIRVAEKLGFQEIDRAENEMGTNIIFARHRPA